ncbi:ankyrin repeat domain-containing protein [Paludibaculum fermentans]|uniref:Ankyrin repeat domain-containing protein n=1 Tax=Paludibaculum fermentans TaxID=1473598 RepID=A0A7S7NNB1_PALFE|nr:ankyrin repeat domain-containing protein [Paludibaculum fermentans]QOY86788.1 ankyrin repeat domain-containing protein [Paludibaculum fermentans]
MHDLSDQKGPQVELSRMPVWGGLAGVLFAAGTSILFARLIWEQTVWTWRQGPQMVGFSLAHGYGAILFVFPVLLAIWTVTVILLTLWQLFRKRRIARARWIALGLVLSLFALGSLPEGVWQRVFIGRMAASPHAASLVLYAAYRGDFGTVQGLLSRGVPVNGVDPTDGRTALHGAAAAGDVRTIRYLMGISANINAVDRFGDSPLELAISNHKDSAARVLVELGARRITGSEAQRNKAIHDQVREQIDRLQPR